MPVDLNCENEASLDGISVPARISPTLAGRGLKSKLVLDTRNYFISKIIPGVMGLLSVMLFVRIVGYEQYGRYAVLVALVTACATGASGWLNHGVLRFQSLHAETRQMVRFQRASNFGLLFSALLGAGITVVMVRIGGDDSISGIIGALVLFFPLMIYTINLTRRQALLESAQVVQIESLRALFSFFLPLAAIWVTKSKNYVVLLGGVAAGYAIPLLIPGLQNRQNRSQTEAPFETSILREIWTYGWPVAFWFFCQQGLVVSDRYFIRHFQGYSAAGVYASVYDVTVRSFSLVFAPITLSVHTVLMHQWNRGSRKDTVQVLRHAMKCEALIFVPVIAGLYFLAGLITRLILGAPNPEASRTILPLAIGGFLWQFALLAHKPLEILCLTKRMLGAALVSLMINVGGNALLVPRFGFLASAYLSVTCACLYILLLLPLTPIHLFRRAIVDGQSDDTRCIPTQDIESSGVL